jgi:hypothetical protein
LKDIRVRSQHGAPITATAPTWSRRSAQPRKPGRQPARPQAQGVGPQQSGCTGRQRPRLDRAGLAHPWPLAGTCVKASGRPTHGA